jgi:hypothetical protein
LQWQPGSSSWRKVLSPRLSGGKITCPYDEGHEGITQGEKPQSPPKLLAELGEKSWTKRRNSGKTAGLKVGG